MARTQSRKEQQDNGSTVKKTVKQNQAAAVAVATKLRASQSADRMAGAVSTSMSSTQVEPTAEQIRRRAYEIFLSRNGTPGDPTADWLLAERELREQLCPSRT